MNYSESLHTAKETDMITATQISERINTHGIIGTTLCRIYEISGMYNTSGEPEIYRAILNGQYNDGSIRYDIMVQRPNGSFAMLNSNRHRQRCNAAFFALRDLIPAYKQANQAARAA